MGLFNRDPLREPMSQRNILGLLLYLLLGGVSTWATSESLITSFDLPALIAYLIGAAVVLLLAALISILKDSVEERRVFMLIFSFIVFLIIWAISLTTNAHKFFTQLKLEDIRKNELEIAINELGNVKDNSRAIGNRVINDYQNKVTSRIKSYEEELCSMKNPGHGPVADTLKRRVEILMPGSDFIIPSGNWSNKRDCRKLADLMGKQMNQELQKRIASMRERLLTVDECEDEDKRKEIEEGLNEANTFFFNKDPIIIKEVLSKAHQYYNRLYQCLENKLIQEIGSINMSEFDFQKKLEMPVPSIKLEKISAIYPYVKKNREHISSFWLCIGIAFGIDLGAFAIFYFMVLREENKY